MTSAWKPPHHRSRSRLGVIAVTSSCDANHKGNRRAKTDWR